MKLVSEQELVLVQEMEHPQDQTRGEPLFLINYINIFNSKAQFPSYLINDFLFLLNIFKLIF